MYPKLLLLDVLPACDVYLEQPHNILFVSFFSGQIYGKYLTEGSVPGEGCKILPS